MGEESPRAGGGGGWGGGELARGHLFAEVPPVMSDSS